MDQRLARIAAEIHADRIVDGGDAASAMLGHDQRLLVPETEEKRAAPCVDPAGDRAGGGGALRGGGAGGAGCGGAAAAGRSYATRCGVLAGARVGAGARVLSTAPPTRAAPPSLREDILRNSSRSGQLAFSAATCAHSISAQFFASRRCAFMSPSR